MFDAAALGMATAAGGAAGGGNAMGMGMLGQILGGLGGQKKQEPQMQPMNFIQPAPMRSTPIPANNDYSWISALMQDPMRTF